MAGFGTRGGLRQVGVVRKDDPTEQPRDSNIPVWKFLPVDNKEQVPTTNESQVAK